MSTNTKTATPGTWAMQELWIEMEEHIDLWTQFAKEGGTALAIEAASTALAALSAERDAQRFYTQSMAPHKQEKETLAPLKNQWPGTFAETNHAVEFLSKAAHSWLEVASQIDHFRLESFPEDSDLRTDLRALIIHVLEQRIRVWTLAQYILVEQVQQWHRGATPTREEETR